MTYKKRMIIKSAIERPVTAGFEGCQEKIWRSLEQAGLIEIIKWEKPTAYKNRVTYKATSAGVKVLSNHKPKPRQSWFMGQRGIA